jgi:hypothetical protein
VGHEHQIDLPPILGSTWLRTLVVLGSMVVVAAGLLKPILAELERTALRAVAAIAVGTETLLLLVTPEVDLPRPLVVVVLAATAAPAVSSSIAAPKGAGGGSPGPPGTVATRLERVCPALVLLVAVGATVELGRAWPDQVDPATAEKLVATTALVGLAGLAWLAVGRARSRRSAVVLGLAGWALGNVVLAAATLLVVQGVPG